MLNVVYGGLCNIEILLHFSAAHVVKSYIKERKTFEFMLPGLLQNHKMQCVFYASVEREFQTFFFSKFSKKKMSLVY